MGDSKVKIKIEQEIKPIKELCEKMITLTKSELEKGAECINAEELGEVVDMIKDLAQAKKETVEACYKMQIMEAMEEAEYGEDYDEMGRIRHYTPRSGGRRVYFTYPEVMNDYPMRDMDREYGRMYYGGNMSTYGNGGGTSSSNMGDMSRGYSEPYTMYPIEMRDSREGRSPRQRKMYMESKEMHKDKNVQMQELDKYIQELGHDLTEMVEGATPEEKATLQQKIATLATKIK